MAMKQVGFATSPGKLRTGKVPVLTEPPTVYRVFAEVKDRYGKREILNLNNGKLPYKSLSRATSILNKHGRGWIEDVNGGIVSVLAIRRSA